MKKFTVIALALAMMLTLFAGCGKTEPAETVPAQELPASALEILETVWANYADEEKFPVIGGNIEANIMDAPGSYDLTYAENMTWNLLVPADRIADVAEAASVIHMMNANTFTCGVFRLAEGVTAADFSAAMQGAIQNNQWLCGFPEKGSGREAAAFRHFRQWVRWRWSPCRDKRQTGAVQKESWRH